MVAAHIGRDVGVKFLSSGDYMIINHGEALEYAYLHRADSNLARCYIELVEGQKPSTNSAMVPFVIVEKFADNGEHSHWAVIERSTGKVFYERHQ